ncbi:MAG: amidase [Alphaproteobacteria bacterium]|nr:amidase [Alphaproteobacteria bacterium]
MTPELPSVAEVLALAEGWGLTLTREEAAFYRAQMGGAIAACARLEAMAPERPAVKYPRGRGTPPQDAADPYKGWAWRCTIAGAPEGFLAGQRLGIKDAICVAGVPMANGTPLLEGYVPEVDATVVTRLLDAGATVLGKTNTENCSFSGGGHTATRGPVRNPYKSSHSPGGSSNGNAVLLATDELDLAVGCDQGGSIRIPAAWSGVYGLKPSYGLVPYTGCIPVEMTMDHCGPMARTVAGIAGMLTAMAGPDPLDPRQRGVIPPDYVRDYRPVLGRGVRGLRIGMVAEGFEQAPWTDLGLPGSEPVVDASVRRAAERLGALGAAVGMVSIPMHMTGPYIWSAIQLEGPAAIMIRDNGMGSNWQGYYNNHLAEAFGAARHARSELLPITIKYLMLTGGYLARRYHGRYYARAQNLRARLVEAYDAALADRDLLLMPTVPFRATPIPAADCSPEDYLACAFNMLNNTCQTNVTGHPAMNVPCGMADGLPIGMMLIGRRFDDATVIAAAAAFEAAGDWRTL